MPRQVEEKPSRLLKAFALWATAATAIAGLSRANAAPNGQDKAVTGYTPPKHSTPPEYCIGTFKVDAQGHIERGMRVVVREEDKHASMVIPAKPRNALISVDIRGCFVVLHDFLFECKNGYKKVVRYYIGGSDNKQPCGSEIVFSNGHVTTGPAARNNFPPNDRASLPPGPLPECDYAQDDGTTIIHRHAEPCPAQPERQWATTIGRQDGRQEVVIR